MRGHAMLGVFILVVGCAPHYDVGGENDAKITGAAAPLAGCVPPGSRAGGPIVANADQVATPFRYSSESGSPGNTGGGAVASANAPPPPNPNCP